MTMQKDIRPGDVWKEYDGDICFIVDLPGPSQDVWEVVAYYPATGYEGRQWLGISAGRWSEDLRELLYRQEENEAPKAEATGLLGLTKAEVDVLRKLLSRLI